MHDAAWLCPAWSRCMCLCQTQHTQPLTSLCGPHLKVPMKYQLTQTGTHTHTHTQSPTHTHTHTHTLTYTHQYTHTHVYTQKHKNTHTRTNMFKIPNHDAIYQKTDPF